MNDRIRSQRIAAICAVAAGLLQLVTMAVQMSAIDFDFEVMMDQSLIITLGERTAEIFRWGQFIEIFGYYLLLLPAVFFFWSWIRVRQPFVADLHTFCGRNQILIGGISTATRFGVLPGAMQRYVLASDAQREMMAVAFDLYLDLAFLGLIMFEWIFLSVWLIGIGLALRRERRAFAFATTVLGGSYVLTILSAVVPIEGLAVLQSIYVLYPFWAIWLGVAIWRLEAQGAHELEPAVLSA